ncbi:MAG: hypothetical protein MI919_00585, partial [Holophagales bacterium]|nr:hypothetical protein [Holophagales bacterium]
MASPDWIEILGRPRPIEVDALRILVVTHRLGTEPRGEPAARDFARVVEGEELLALLDQLVRRPITAVYLLLDLFRRRPELAGRRAEMARRVRQRLAVDRQRRQPARRRRPWKSAADALEESRRRHPFEPPRWRRLDAPVAFLSSRGLMGFHLEEAVRGPAGGSVPPVQITYGLTEAGERLLEERAYPEDRDRTLVLQVCEALAELLPLV